MFGLFGRAKKFQTDLVLEHILMAANSTSYGASALKSSGPTMSMVDMGSVGIGNYKGVMLCNRPFGGTAANKAPGVSASDKTTFTCGVVSEPAGLNVPISAKEKMAKRPNKDSVLAKHKKWLADLQKTKDRLEVELLEETKKKEESQAKFQEHEKKMRLAARTALHAPSGEASDSKDAKDSKDSKEDSKFFTGAQSSSAYGGSEEAKAEPKHEAGGGTGPGAKQGQQHKPAWAMTEQAAGVQDEEAALGEEDALLEFAKGLDFDRYMGDVEVQTVMERLRRRIADLEKEVAADDQRSVDAEARAALRSKLEQMGLTEQSLLDEARGGPQSEESAALAAARALLGEEEDMQAVHSTKSVAAMLKSAKEKIAQVRAAVQPAQEPSGEPKIANQPLIVVHDPNEGARLEVKNALSKLPYMNRNPAV